MEPTTHTAIDPELSGHVDALEPGAAVVTLQTTDRMRADERGLVHGGFVFSAADYAAMLAVGDPNVVLGSAEVRFTAPVAVGDTVSLQANVRAEEGRKRRVDVEGTVEGRTVFHGAFTAFVLDEHVLGGEG